MTAGYRHAEELLLLVRELANDLRAEELPSAAFDRAAALRFYSRSRCAASLEERFLALYNALGTLDGFGAARSEMDALLGGVDAALCAARNEGDRESTFVRFPYDGEQLDRLASELRRRLARG